MSALFNENEADAEVISNLIKEIRRLTPMPLLQLNDGRVIRTEQFEVVSVEELRADLSRAQEKVTELQGFMPIDTVAAPVADPEVPAPTPDAAEQPVPAPTITDHNVVLPPADVVPPAPVDEIPPLQ